jgi:hypothetical protein
MPRNTRHSFFKLNPAILASDRPAVKPSSLELMPTELLLQVALGLGINDCTNLAMTSTSMARFFENNKGLLLTIDPKQIYELKLLNDFIPVRLGWEWVRNRWDRGYIRAEGNVHYRRMDCASCGSILIVAGPGRESQALVQHVKADARAGRLRLTRHLMGAL